MARDDNKIAALKREKAGYLAAGDEVRALQVDEQLRHYGYTPEPQAEGKPVDEDGAPKGRTRGRQRTADKTSDDAQSAGRGSARKSGGE